LFVAVDIVAAALTIDFVVVATFAVGAVVAVFSLYL